MTQPGLIALKQRYSDGSLSKQEFIREALDFHRRLCDYVSITETTDIGEINISPDGVRFVMSDESIQLYAPTDQARVAPIEAMNFGRYEPDETRVMDILSSGALRVLDIGANIGWHAIRFARREPQALIFAFEPMPDSFAYLQRNIAVNALGAQVTSFNYGLADVAGSVDFFVAPGSGTNASLVNVAGAVDARRVVGLTLTLDLWCANQKIKPEFIKCDVEGAELLVFRGGQQVLSRDRPVVFSELLRKWTKPFGYHPNQVFSFFRDLGYRCYAVGARVRVIESVTDETTETNYAFVHAEAHADKIALLDELR